MSKDSSRHSSSRHSSSRPIEIIGSNKNQSSIFVDSSDDEGLFVGSPDDFEEQQDKKKTAELLNRLSKSNEFLDVFGFDDLEISSQNEEIKTANNSKNVGSSNLVDSNSKDKPDTSVSSSSLGGKLQKNSESKIQGN